MLGSHKGCAQRLETKQRGYQTRQRQEQKHFISEGAGWEFPWNWVTSTHYHLGESREAHTEG